MGAKIQCLPLFRWRVESYRSLIRRVVEKKDSVIQKGPTNDSRNLMIDSKVQNGTKTNKEKMAKGISHQLRDVVLSIGYSWCHMVTAYVTWSQLV